MWEGFLQGTFIREDGYLRRVPLGSYTWEAPFPTGSRKTVAIPWGDLAAGYYTTGIPNIITYGALPARIISLLRTLCTAARFPFGYRRHGRSIFPDEREIKSEAAIRNRAKAPISEQATARARGSGESLRDSLGVTR